MSSDMMRMMLVAARRLLPRRAAENACRISRVAGRDTSSRLVCISIAQDSPVTC